MRPYFRYNNQVVKKNRTFLRLKISVLFSAIILLFTGALCALNPDIAVTQYVIDNWTVDDGLPQNTVTVITQTHDGYLWVGTGNGLARFDGSDFTIFNTSNTEELIGHDIRILFEDSSRTLWIASMKGLCRIRDGRFEDFPGPVEFNNEPINAILEDKKNNLWFRTDIGVSRYKNNKFETLRGQEKLSGRKITSLYEDSQSSMWIGSDAGLFCFKNGKIEQVDKPEGIKKKIIERIFEDKNGRLWIYAGKNLVCFGNSTQKHFKGLGGFNLNGFVQDRWGDLWFATDAGLKRFGNDRLEPVGRKSGLARSDIRKLVKDRDGNLWIGTRQGLYRYRQGQFALLSKENGLIDDDVHCLFEDRQGNLWIGTKRGLTRLKNPRIITYSTEEGLDCDSLRAIFQDSRGSMWVSGDCHGLTRFKDGEFKIFSKQTGYHGLRFGGAFCEDSSGHLWSGIDLNRFREGNFERFKTIDDRTTGAVLVILEDHPGRFWVGTKYGLLLFKPSEPMEDRFTEFTTKDGLTSNYISEIVKTRDGTLWLGTLKGLTLLKDGKFYPVQDGSGLAHEQVNDIYQDEEGPIWIGTYGGLYRYSANRYFHYTGRNGMVDDAILGILEDGKGNLWMSSNVGIFYIKKKELHNLASGKTGSLHPVSFDRNDGMKNEECNCGTQPSCWKSRDGRLWFPTMKGVVVVDPGNLKLHRQPPPVYIEKVLLDGKFVKMDETINVPPGTRRIEFFYTAVDFTKLGQVRFRYRLDGHETQWIEQDSARERIAHYMNVPGGDYCFRVTASSSDGFWDMNNHASITMSIVPTFSETWWYKTLILLLFASLSYLIFNFFKKYFYLFAFWKRTNYIGQYVIIEPIGYGAMATVYKARHILKKKKIVAVKVLKREFISRPLSKKRFKQEGVIIDKMEHPHIIKIFERGEQEDNFYIVMEFLPGHTLAEKIKNEKQLTVADFLDIMGQLVSVLTVLHGRHIIHRDLKPSNIMLVEKDGRHNFVKLLDFGLARSHYDTRITESGSLLGTLPYISPEQITHSVFSPAGDIYATGIIAYEMITGILPFADCSELEILQKKLDKQPVEPIVLRPNTPLFINKLIMDMMARDPEVRPTAQMISAKLKVQPAVNAGTTLRSQ